MSLRGMVLPERWILGTILLIALCARLLYIYSLGSEIAYPIRDQSYYLDIARNLAAGKGFTLSLEYWELRKRMITLIPQYRQKYANLDEWLKSTPWGIIRAGEPTSFCTPLYPLFLAIIIKTFGENYIVIRIVQTIISLALVLLLYLIGKQLFDSKVGSLAAFIAALYPFFIYYTGYAMTETLNITLISLLVYLFYKTARCESEVLPFLLGSVLALTSLMRAMMFAFFFVIIILLLIEYSSKNRMRRIVIFILGFTLFFSPWVIRNYLVHKELVILPTTGGATLWMRNNPEVVVPEMERAGYPVPERLLKNLRKKELLEYPRFRNENEVERNRIIIMVHVLLRKYREILLVQGDRSIYVGNYLAPLPRRHNHPDHEREVQKSTIHFDNYGILYYSAYFVSWWDQIQASH